MVPYKLKDVIADAEMLRKAVKPEELTVKKPIAFDLYSQSEKYLVVVPDGSQDSPPAALSIVAFVGRLETLLNTHSISFPVFRISTPPELYKVVGVKSATSAKFLEPSAMMSGYSVLFPLALT